MDQFCKWNTNPSKPLLVKSLNNPEANLVQCCPRVAFISFYILRNNFKEPFVH